MLDFLVSNARHSLSFESSEQLQLPKIDKMFLIVP